MKYNTDPIFEAYSNHRKQFILEQSIAKFYSSDHLQQIHDLYQYDLACIEELVTEGMLGDAFGKVKSGIGKATSYIANKGLQLLFSLIKKTATPEELEEIKKLKDPEVLKQEAKKGMAALKDSESEQTVTNNEGVYLNKSFFASILTESNIEVMLERYSFINEQILTERKRNFSGGGIKSKSPKAATWVSKFDKTAARKRGGKKAQEKAQEKAQKKQTQTRGKGNITKYAQQVAKELKSRYSQSASQLENGFRDFQRILSNKIGISPKEVSQRAPITSLPKRPTDVLKGEEGSLVPVSSGKERVSPQLGYGGSSNLTKIEPKPDDIQVEPISSTTSDIKSNELPYTGVSAPATKKKEGLIRKAINWVKANPKRTAGTLAGIVAAIGIAVGGPAVLIPMLAKAGLGSVASGAITGAVGGAGLGAAKNIASQGFSNKKFSGKQLGKAALKGGAIGATGGAIKGLFDYMGSDDTDDQGDSDYLEDKDRGETTQYKQAEPKDIGDTGEVTDEEFRKYTDSDYDEKSYQDRAIKQAFQNIKNKRGGVLGNREAEKASDDIINFIRKNPRMRDVDQIIAKVVPWTLGESYTAQYLSLLR